MTGLIAALPMYDWPQLRGEVDAQWAGIRDRFRRAGIAAPDRLARRNADLPPVPGGICDAEGRQIAPDPATLPPDELDLFTLWRHPALLFAQTCWGPMGSGLEPHVSVVSQPDYSDYEGGEGELYSSAIVMRGDRQHARPPVDGCAAIPLDLIRGGRFAFNSRDSMSGLLAIESDLQASGEGLDIFGARTETGSHRDSARMVAQGAADVAAIDCRTLALIRRFEPQVASALTIVGWTARRNGLPFIRARGLADGILQRWPVLV